MIQTDFQHCLSLNIKEWLKNTVCRFHPLGLNKMFCIYELLQRTEPMQTMCRSHTKAGGERKNLTDDLENK